MKIAGVDTGKIATAKKDGIDRSAAERRLALEGTSDEGDRKIEIGIGEIELTGNPGADDAHAVASASSIQDWPVSAAFAPSLQRAFDRRSIALHRQDYWQAGSIALKSIIAPFADASINFNSAGVASCARAILAYPLARASWYGSRR